ncbi:MAG: hypothetical protein L6R42_001521 [Xanthoria sp. 1 TBL-2021]|nr:MAG: hypothetical protein L6R42_001521 [Xanthoria sp. 1 TBL-2021]
MPKFDSGGAANVATAIVFVVLDSLAVFLRILSKSKTKHYFSADDWWILAALVFFYAWAGQILYGQCPVQCSWLVRSDFASCGRNRRIFGGDDAHECWRCSGSFEGFPQLLDCSCIAGLLNDRQILWVAELFFPFTITCVKISILCFYRTIFSTRTFRRVTYAISAICAMWMFAGFWVIIFQCRPVRAVYDTSLAATADCFPFARFVFTYELTNALIDVSILVLPIYMVRQLQMETRQKLQVISIFAMGGL